jgi:hypothetical protein
VVDDLDVAETMARQAIQEVRLEVLDVPLRSRPSIDFDESFRTIECGLRQIMTGRTIHALTIAPDGLALCVRLPSACRARQ